MANRGGQPGVGQRRLATRNELAMIAALREQNAIHKEQMLAQTAAVTALTEALQLECAKVNAVTSALKKQTRETQARFKRQLDQFAAMNQREGDDDEGAHPLPPPPQVAPHPGHPHVHRRRVLPMAAPSLIGRPLNSWRYPALPQDPNKFLVEGLEFNLQPVQGGDGVAERVEVGGVSFLRVDRCLYRIVDKDDPRLLDVDLGDRVRLQFTKNPAAYAVIQGLGMVKLGTMNSDGKTWRVELQNHMWHVASGSIGNEVHEVLLRFV